jgi:hypothetical protein
MAIFNYSNQLLQIDTGASRTFFYNPTLGLGAITPYQGIGENQVLGQRYVGVTNTTPTNPAGSPAYFMLVQYLATSALTTANLTTANAPAPVYWTDNTFTTVTAITTEGIGGTTLGLAFPAGFMMLNKTSVTGLTAAQLLGAQILIQVGGYLKGAYMSSSSSAGIGAWIVPSAGTFSSAFIAAGSSATYQPFGRQLTALASGLCDVLVGCDND